MKIALLEPFLSGSHLDWAKGYQQSSQHDVEIFSLPGRHWKWRMHGGAISLANQYLAAGFQADLILATDMLDLSYFLALTRQLTARIPTAIYFHENQLTYPWSPDDEDVALKRDLHYAFINYTSALAADAVFFNSQYHLDSFTQALPPFLGRYPDFKELQMPDRILQKSTILSLGLDLKGLDIKEGVQRSGPAVILWNHRWEYDKAPDDFFQALFQLEEEGVDFRLVVLGESYQKSPAIFKEAKERLATKILFFGYAPSREAYRLWLWQSDILFVSSRQDFFGASIAEAMYCQCHPILPKRLAYPEHIPVQLHDTYLYEDAADGFNKLRQAVDRIDEIRRSNSYSNFVARYDWSILAPVYDEQLTRLFEAKGFSPSTSV